MKKQTTLLFFENKLSGYLDNASDIFGLDIARYTGAKTEDIFSNETALHLKNLPFGTTDEKIGFKSGVILDARVIKSNLSDYTVLLMEFKAEKSLNPLGRLRTDTIFENILTAHLPQIEEKVNSFSTGRNKKAVISLKNEIFALVSSVVSLVNDSHNNDILNAPENLCYIDLLEFLREIEKDIRSLGNISWDTIPYSAFYTYMKRTHTKDLISGITTYYIANEYHPYITCYKEYENMIVRIASYPYGKIADNDNSAQIDAEYIKVTTNFKKQASDCCIALNRNSYNKNQDEFILVFTPDKIDTIREI